MYCFKLAMQHTITKNKHKCLWYIMRFYEMKKPHSLQNGRLINHVSDIGQISVGTLSHLQLIRVYFKLVKIS